MTSTLADLQRRNLEKMEATDPPPAAAPSNTAAAPSNEVSIIPSSAQSFTQSNAHSSDGVKDDVIEGSHDGVGGDPTKPSKTDVGPPRDGSKARVNAPNAKTAKQGPAQSHAQTPDVSLKGALDVRLREHLMEQLMPSGGKGPVTRLNVEMPEDLHQRLKQHCVKTRTPIKGLINALIAFYLDAEEA